MTNCADLVIFAFTPFVWVALNFVLTPSNATFNVWEDPAPTPVILTAVPLIALFALVANLIVLWSSLIMKYTPSESPVITVPPPLLYVTLCPVINLWFNEVIVSFAAETHSNLNHQKLTYMMIYRQVF